MRFESRVNTQSPEFIQNKKDWSMLLAELAEKKAYSISQGTETYIQRHIARGMLLARDRIALLIDPDSEFLDIQPFIGIGLEDETPCANLIAGIARIEGRQVLVLSHIPTINGGAWTRKMVQKQIRCMQIATQNLLPVCALVQSAGVYLPNQFDIFHPGGTIFRDLATHALEGGFSCSVVFGSGTAGGAYQPGLSGHTIFVKDQAQVFLGGPPLVKMATGEVIEAEALGGAEMHSRESGLSDDLASDEFEAIAKAREWVSRLPLSPSSRVAMVRSGAMRRGGGREGFQDPRFDSEDLLGIVSTNIKTPFDMCEIIARIVDGSSSTPFKPLYGINLPCHFATIKGHAVGIIGNNNGVIHTPESQKAVHFISLCNQRAIPIIFLHNVTGFMVGSRSEKGGLIKNGALFVGAVVASKVPHISMITGASYGAGNYAMCGRSYAPRFLFSWAHSKCSVMGSEQLSGVLSQIARSSSLSRGLEVDEQVVLRREEEFRMRVERDSSVWRTSGEGLDDGVIDPRETRDVLGICLDVVTGSARGVVGREGMKGVVRL